MDDETKKILKEAFDRLPKDLQEAILSTDISAKLSQISEKNGLRTDQGTALENEVIMTIMNLEPIEDLLSNVKENLEVNSQKAGEIVSDINELIFKSIRSSMQAIQESDNKAEEKEEENLDRNEILREIENPELDIKRTFSETSSPIPPTPVAPAASEVETSDVSKPKSAFEEKFFKTTSLPMEKENQTSSQKIRPYGGPSVDPYREPTE